MQISLKLSIIFIFLSLFLFHSYFLATTAYSQVGLINSVESAALSEAVTSSVEGSDSLFYNPAGLSFLQYPAFNLAEISTILDKESYDLAEKYSNKNFAEKFSSIDEVYGLIKDKKPIHLESQSRILDLALPHFAVVPFVQGKIASHKENDGADTIYNYDFRARLGLIVGLAFSFGGFSIGYSYYQLAQSSVITNPKESDLDTIKQHIEADTLEVDSVDFPSFTTIQYGISQGHNIGIMYRFDKERPSGIGVSVLNMGDSKFIKKIPRVVENAKNIENQITQEAETYNITVEKPEPIAQLVNLGATWGYGNLQDEFFIAKLSLEADDIIGDTIDNKFACSAELGVQLPNQLAMALSIPVPYRDVVYHIGLLSLKLLGGTRVNESFSYGAKIELHGGAHYVSLLKFTLVGMKNEFFDNDKETQEIDGLNLRVGLTLVF